MIFLKALMPIYKEQKHILTITSTRVLCTLMGPIPSILVVLSTS